MSGLSLQTAALPPAPLFRRTACIDLLLAGSWVAYVDVRLLSVVVLPLQCFVWWGSAVSLHASWLQALEEPMALPARAPGGGALATSCWAHRVIPIVFLFFPPPAKAATPAVLRDRFRFVSSLTVEGRTFWAWKGIWDVSYKIFRYPVRQIGENYLWPYSPGSHNCYRQQQFAFLHFTFVIKASEPFCLEVLYKTIKETRD